MARCMSGMYISRTASCICFSPKHQSAMIDTGRRCINTHSRQVTLSPDDSDADEGNLISETSAIGDHL